MSVEDGLMVRAVALAIENVRAARGGPFAALIAKGGAVIACGTNLVTSTNDPTAHAEIVAIREACRALGTFVLAGCEIYTTCEPCPMCMGAIYWARLDRVFYAATRADAARIGFDDAYIYDQLRLPIEGRVLTMIPVSREAALAAFREWEAIPDKKRY